jgi:hypothetical protein
VGSTNASALPQGTAGDVLKKAAVTGAMGGIAVAASGGSTQDSLNAFIRSGGAVIVQAGEAYFDANVVVESETQLNSFCTTQTGMTCASGKQWVDKAAKSVEQLKSLKTVHPTVALTQGGDWAISWDAERVKTLQPNEPAVTLTYVGPGSSYRQALKKIAALSSSRFQDPQDVVTRDRRHQVASTQSANVEQHNKRSTDPDRRWVAFRDVGDRASFFNDPATGRNKSAPVVGDFLIANRDINIRARPADWTGPKAVLKSGERIMILEIRSLPAGRHEQEWIRIGIR